MPGATFASQCLTVLLLSSTYIRLYEIDSPRNRFETQDLHYAALETSLRYTLHSR